MATKTYWRKGVRITEFTGDDLSSLAERRKQATQYLIPKEDWKTFRSMHLSCYLFLVYSGLMWWLYLILS